MSNVMNGNFKCIDRISKVLVSLPFEVNAKANFAC